MKTRKSLSQKIAECLQKGSLTTYSLESAIEHFKDSKECTLDEIRSLYSSGKVYLKFEYYDKTSAKLSISQFNTLDKFITEYIYPHL